jgi:ssDNA-binding Zn-finger/Zn-ribbon topoisomerase 1
MGKFDPDCPVCGQSLIQVSRVYTVDFYACNNEQCEDYAELKLNTGTKEEPYLVGYFHMIETMNNMSKEMKDIKEDTPMLGYEEEEHY